MKKVKAGLALSSALLLLGACGGSGSTENEAGQTEILVWTWPNNDKTFEEITIPLFEKEHPDIKVNVQAFGIDVYHNKLSSAVIGGQGPDVAMIEVSQMSQFKELEAFEDLNQEPYNAAELSDQYADLFWSYVTGDDGYIFALPKNTGPAAMFYNKTIFEEAGLPTEPEEVHELLSTWEDYINVSKQIVEPGETWMVSTPNLVVEAMIQQGGESYFNEEGELQIENEAFMDSYETVQQLKDLGAISPYAEWSSEWNATMQNGTVATYLYGNWFGDFINNNASGTEGDWGVTFAPAYKGESAFNSGGDFIGVLKNSEVKEAAWEFTKFVTQNEENLKSMYQDNALYPAYLDVIDEDWMNNESELFGGQVTNDIFKEVSLNMKTRYITENDPAARTAVEKMLNNLVLSDTSLEDALDQAKQEIEARAR